MTDETHEGASRPAAPRRANAIRTPRMATPISEPMELTDAPVVEPASAPRARRETDELPAAPELQLAANHQAEDDAVPTRATAEREPARRAADPDDRELASTEPGGGAAESPGPPPDAPLTARETLRRVDESWRAFFAAAARYPAERMDERLGEDAWTRKQMLAHVAAWHDLTAERLIKYLSTGQPPAFDGDADQFNATTARRAAGKTAGEVLNDTQSTFNRLRRQLQRLTDAHLKEHDWWAAWVIQGNTYGHYDEHRDDIHTPEPAGGKSRR